MRQLMLQLLSSMLRWIPMQPRIAGILRCLDPSHVMTTYAAMHCSTFSMLTTDMALMWRQCCSHVK